MATETGDKDVSGLKMENSSIVSIVCEIPVLFQVATHDHKFLPASKKYVGLWVSMSIST